MLRVFPVRKNKVFISNFYGKGYGDSPKYICNELLRMDPTCEIVWSIKNEKEAINLPKEVRAVRRNTFRYIYEHVTSRIWIDNCRKSFFERKRNNQFYIQTWHSSLRLKKIEKDAEKDLDPGYVKDCKNDSKMINLITSGSDFSTGIYKKSFWYNGRVVKTGTPRCDILLNKTDAKKMRAKIDERFKTNNKIIVLYAPTFRKNKEDEVYYLDCQELSRRLGDDYSVLARMHPISKFRITESDSVKDATKYPDMQELLLASDFLITGYSGCCFDMMIAKKPCILYTPDIKQYLAKERDLYFDFKELPFYNTGTVDELAHHIREFDNEKYQVAIRKFDRKIGLKEDGRASVHIAKIIADVINE